MSSSNNTKTSEIKGTCVYEVNVKINRPICEPGVNSAYAYTREEYNGWITCSLIKRFQGKYYCVYDKPVNGNVICFVNKGSFQQLYPSQLSPCLTTVYEYIMSNGCSRSPTNSECGGKLKFPINVKHHYKIRSSVVDLLTGGSNTKSTNKGDQRMYRGIKLDSEIVSNLEKCDKMFNKVDKLLSSVPSWQPIHRLNKSYSDLSYMNLSTPHVRVFSVKKMMGAKTDKFFKWIRENLKEFMKYMENIEKDNEDAFTYVCEQLIDYLTNDEFKLK